MTARRTAPLLFNNTTPTAVVTRMRSGGTRGSAWSASAASVCAAPAKRWSSNSSVTVKLNYQIRHPSGRRTGRYIGRPDLGDVVDEYSPGTATINDARLLGVPPSLASHGFELRHAPTSVADFSHPLAVKEGYYAETEVLVKAATGAGEVLVFDHTLRTSGNVNPNAVAGATSAAPAVRVHCDYTVDSAPRRLEQLIGADRIRDEIGDRRFAFLNVWRSIDIEHPVMRQPLACLAPQSVDDSDRFLYHLLFPTRAGENYSLVHSESHLWYYFPLMTADEVMLFSVYDRQADTPRFVFHTAFDLPDTPSDAPPRRSIELRTIAIWE